MIRTLTLIFGLMLFVVVGCTQDEKPAAANPGANGEHAEDDGGEHAHPDGDAASDEGSAKKEGMEEGSAKKEGMEEGDKEGMDMP